MSAIISTILLDIYIFLLSLQVNGVSLTTQDFRMYIFLFLLVQAAWLLFTDALKKHNNLLPKKNHFFNIATGYLIYTGFYLLFLDFTLGQVLEVLYFPLCVVITYASYKQVTNTKTFDIIIKLQFFLLLAVAAVFIYAQVLRLTDAAKNINTVYYLVFLLPFILQNKSRFQKIVGICIILLCVFWSAKRAPLIAIALIFLLVNKNNSKHRIQTIILNSITVVIAGLILNAIIQAATNINALDRLLNLFEDGGSGRTDLGLQVLEKFSEGNFFEWLFGNRMQYSANVVHLGAHNDFIEVLYRLGIFGFVAYLLFYRALFNHAKICQTNNNFDDAALIYSTIIIFAIISFASQLIFLPTYIGLVAMSCNLAICRNNLIAE